MPRKAQGGSGLLMVAQGCSVAQVRSGELSVLRGGSDGAQGGSSALKGAQMCSVVLRCAQGLLRWPRWCSVLLKCAQGGPGQAQARAIWLRGAQGRSGWLREGGGLRETQWGSSGPGELRVVQWCSGRHRVSSGGLKATQGVSVWSRVLREAYGGSIWLWGAQGGSKKLRVAQGRSGRLRWAHVCSGWLRGAQVGSGTLRVAQWCSE